MRNVVTHFIYHHNVPDNIFPEITITVNVVPVV